MLGKRFLCPSYLLNIIIPQGLHRTRRGTKYVGIVPTLLSLDNVLYLVPNNVYPTCVRIVPTLLSHSTKLSSIPTLSLYNNDSTN